MKDLLFIDRGLLNNFRANAIDIVNYFRNKLSTKYKYRKIIP